MNEKEEINILFYYVQINLEARGEHAGKYLIRKSNFEHNHEINESYYKHYFRNRKLPDAIRIEAETMIKNGAKPALIAQHCSEKANLVVTPRDIYNVRVGIEFKEFGASRINMKKNDIVALAEVSENE